MEINGQDKLRQYVREHTLKQSDISKQTGINQFNLNKWIMGQDILGYKALRDLED